MNFSRHLLGAGAVRSVATLLLGSTALTTGLVAAAMADGTAPAQPAPAEVQKADAAAKPDAAKDDGVEKVTVTATRRRQRVLDVPYNISVVSGKDIEKGKVVDNAELVRMIPGVNFTDRGARNASTVSGLKIRGINADSSALGDYAVSGVAPVSTYVDETPIFANFLLKDIKRVEILRGPQGTLYGSGSLGGTLRYIMNEPEFDGIHATAGSTVSYVDGSATAGWSWDAMLNVPLADNLAIRIVGTLNDYPGITDYVNLYKLDANGIPVAPLGRGNAAASYYSKKDADTLDQLYLRASMLWIPTSWWSMSLSYTGQSDEYGGRRSNTPGTDGFGRPYQPHESGSIQMEPGSRDVGVTALENTFDLGFATLTSSTSYYDHEGESQSENTGFYAKAGFLNFYYTYPRPMAEADRSYGDESFVQEARIVSNEGGKFDYVLGVYYQHQNISSTQDSFLRGFKLWWDQIYCGGFGPCVAAVSSDQDFLYRRKEEYSQTAVFGELTWHVSEKAQITGGVRQFWNKSDATTDMDVPVYTFLSAPVHKQFIDEDSKALFKINASYYFAEDNMVYATVSEGYRRGGANAVPTTGRYAENAAWQTYKPDTAVNYEIGVKGLLHGQNYGVTAFMIDWDEIQLNTATPNWGFYVAANGKTARSMGIEAELVGNLTESLRYTAGYTYTDATLTDDFRSPTGTLLARDGDRLPGIPEHTVRGSLEYSTSISDSIPLTTRFDGYYQSDMRNALGTSTTFNVPLDGYAIFNASASVDLGKAYVTLFVKNIFDEDGITGKYTEAYMGSRPAVGYNGNGAKDLISLPRTVGLSLNYKIQ
jgi:outer membrane receptor protein involved in Fe transport